MRTSDEELMARCRNGDMSAFELLVIRYKDLIINYIHRCICDYQRAEDLTQETFIRVLRSASSYEPKCQFKNWIYLIATNLCRNEVRNRHRRNTCFLDDLVSEGEDINYSYVMRDVSYLPDELYEKKEQQLMIQQTLSLLPDNQRIALKPGDLSRFKIRRNCRNHELLCERGEIIDSPGTPKYENATA